MNRFFSLLLIGLLSIIISGCNKDKSPPEIASIEALPISMYFDETAKLSIKYFPLDATAPVSYTYKTSDEYVAVVDNKGVVRGKHVGECVITIATDKGITNKCMVTIKPRSTLYREPYLVFGASVADIKAYEKRTLVYEDEDDVGEFLIYEGENKYVESVEYDFENSKLVDCFVFLSTIDLETFEYCLNEAELFLFERYICYTDGKDKVWEGKGILAFLDFEVWDDFGDVLYVLYKPDPLAKSGKFLPDKNKLERYKALIREYRKGK